MTDEQLEAACGEAKAVGLRTIVHAHSAESAKAATLAGCTSIEHGAYVTDDVFSLMEQKGTYYDPNIGLVLQNYLENKPKFLGRGNYTEEGFAFMEKGIAITRDTFKKALAHKKLKIVYGTDAVAGAHGRNYEEFIVRVRDGGQEPMAALESDFHLGRVAQHAGPDRLPRRRNAGRYHRFRWRSPARRQRRAPRRVRYEGRKSLRKRPPPLTQRDVWHRLSSNLEAGSAFITLGG